jgi:hypothetical protein
MTLVSHQGASHVKLNYRELCVIAFGFEIVDLSKT